MPDTEVHSFPIPVDQSHYRGAIAPPAWLEKLLAERPATSEALTHLTGAAAEEEPAVDDSELLEALRTFTREP